MPWSQIRGQQLMKECLARLIEAGRVGGTYLFYGPPGSEQEPMALAFISAILCEKQNADFCGTCSVCKRIQARVYPDVFILEPEGAFYKIDQLRTMQSIALSSPHEARYKIFVLRQAERMRQEGANSLLKILEEPYPHVIFVLLTDNISAILPTVISRCQRIRLAPLSPEEVADELCETANVDREMAATLARVSGGRIGQARNLLEETWLERRDEILALLKELRTSSRLAIPRTTQAWGRDREAAKERLLALLSILRDALICSSAGDGGLFLNVDRTDAIQSLWRDVDPDRIIRAFETAVDGLDGIDRYLNVQNVMEGVLMACAEE